jgi:hypothetical protein
VAVRRYTAWIRLTEATGQSSKISELTRQVEAHSTQLKGIESRLAVLEHDAAGHRRIRHRILDNYCKRTLLPRGIISKADVNHARIEDGNMAAHRGNAESDADLYFNGYRSDEVTMRYMYGLESSEIRMLRES